MRFDLGRFAGPLLSVLAAAGALVACSAASDVQGDGLSKAGAPSIGSTPQFFGRNGPGLTARTDAVMFVADERAGVVHRVRMEPFGFAGEPLPLPFTDHAVGIVAPENGRYCVEIGDHGYAIVTLDGQVSVDPAPLSGKIRSVAFDRSNHRAVLVDDLGSVLMLALNPDGSLAGQFLAGSLIDGARSFRTGTLLPDGRLALGLDDGQLAVVDVAASILEQKWRFELVAVPLPTPTPTPTSTSTSTPAATATPTAAPAVTAVATTLITTTTPPDRSKLATASAESTPTPSPAITWVGASLTKPGLVLVAVADRVAVVDLDAKTVLDSAPVDDALLVLGSERGHPHLVARATAGDKLSLFALLTDGKLHVSTLPATYPTSTAIFSELSESGDVVTARVIDGAATPTRHETDGQGSLDPISEGFQPQTLYRIRLTDGLLMTRLEMPRAARVAQVGDFLLEQFDSLLGHLARVRIARPADVVDLTGYDLDRLRD
jgi:hypothetical protein